MGKPLRRMDKLRRARRVKRARRRRTGAAPRGKMTARARRPTMGRTGTTGRMGSRRMAAKRVEMRSRMAHRRMGRRIVACLAWLSGFWSMWRTSRTNGDRAASGAAPKNALSGGRMSRR